VACPPIKSVAFEGTPTSTSPNGNGGAINITSPAFHKNASTVIDASSGGTVTINGVVQP